MSRPNRTTPGGIPFHVLNRAVGRRTLFSTAEDYIVFLETIAETLRTQPMRVCPYCVMPNHWHLILWPELDGALSAFVQHLTNLHVKRWKKAHGEVGYGHLYQGRFKSFPVQSDTYFYTVVRYIERNPVRANLVRSADQWPWSSLGQTSLEAPIPMAPWPVPEPPTAGRQEWVDWVNWPQTEAELAALRTCVSRGQPFGDQAWVHATAGQLDLGSTLRPRGRPPQQGLSDQRPR